MHFDMPADDMKRATTFFSNVFGWKFDGYAPDNNYQMATTGEAPEGGINGGIYKRTAPQQIMMNHIGVESIDAIIPVIEKNGGKIAVPKSPIPSMGYYAIFFDTEGNQHGLFQHDPSVA